MKPVTIVAGGQFGSEAKGSVCGWLAVNEPYDIAVRTGATNAGHSVDYHGNIYVNQQLPVAWVNVDTKLVIGAGALVDLDILRREITMIDDAIGIPGRTARRLFVDPRAFIHYPAHKSRSAESGRHHAIGATGKGCSEALIDRVRLRGTATDYPKTIGQLADSGCPVEFTVTDTERYINDVINDGGRVMIEGTQGQLLDLCLGPYPYVTHKQTGPAVWLAEAGISPNVPLDVVMVVRTFPIRVAGNSGPLPNEISWYDLANEINIRRDRCDLSSPDIIPYDVLHRFRCAVEDCVRDGLAICPPGSNGMDQHLWSPEDRVTYREALSELHKLALGRLNAYDTMQLRRLFEMTTVTKKLRRIARLDRASLETAARQIRPSRIAVTFLNYVFPERWYKSHPIMLDERVWLMDNIEVPTGAKVFLVNRGPRMEHFQRVKS